MYLRFHLLFILWLNLCMAVETHTRDYIEQRWLLSCVHTVIAYIQLKYIQSIPFHTIYNTIQFYPFWGNLTRNQTDNVRYWQKNNCLRFSKWFKIYIFSHSKFEKSGNMTPKNQHGYKKRRILCWFQIRCCRLSKMFLQEIISKKTRKNVQNA